ncbi:MAG: bifunctional 4-hydroxy-3-methylbut-2-enyl diphosphate reductase/30S ribosomal protein S1 [Firmicutes bacterium]|nr:bifunctional 4-hydroxy-3-methylbut-2-enyl diphosphate reductase/30S ribosomal protein S1 [Bacillota bacterium]MDD4336122.1 bifunctional 4-hydroxy-3-methylbut-2-enyl diphosphate reductase/30S ribosomal protein S1 [Bacillota bacterium]MDD4792389.1 bifunctional 4-hydroxy-3-methylbut-2-enyl diphosphate reductase/30S ribosomal protein S1 [Bacillota bacterium]
MSSDTIIREAAYSGFCKGVERAVRIASDTGREALRSGSAGAVTLGPLVHNPDVVSSLLECGVEQVDSIESAQGRVLIIPSHGLSPEIAQAARERGLTLVDATCPHVLRAQREVERAHDEGRYVVLVGDKRHPEIRGVAAFAADNIAVVSDTDEAQSLALPSRPITVVAQTTQKQSLFEAVAEVLRSRGAEVDTVNTICPATSERQEAARALASEVDLMVVIGGKASANTMRLAEVCRDAGARVLKVENVCGLDHGVIRNARTIGVTAGASTPSWVIEEVKVAMHEIIEGNSEEARCLETQDGKDCEARASELAEKQEEIAVEQAEPAPEETTECAAVEPSEASCAKEEHDATCPEECEANATGAEIDEPAAHGGEAVAEEEQVEAVDSEASEADEKKAVSEDEKPEVEAEQPAADTITPPAHEFPSDPDVVAARVKEICDDRVTVEIEPGEDAIIFKKHLSIEQISHPSEVVSEGEEIYVVLDDSQRPSSDTLYASKTRADTILKWQTLENAMETGEIVEGKVTEAVKGGLVVDIGVRGFVPASQVGRRFVEDLSVYVGQTLRMKVREVERLRSNVVLSHREVLEEEERLAKQSAFETLERGQVLDGTVTRLVSFGAFVDIGDGVEGLLHISDISWSRIKHPGEVLAEGQSVKVKVLNVDRERERISLGYKQLLPDPWEDVAERFAVGSVVTGVVTKTVDFGAFVRLEDGIEGLVHISQLADRRVGRPEEVVTAGETVTVKVIGLRPQEHRISLSIRQALEDRERSEYKRYMKASKDSDVVTIADRINYDPSKLKGSTDGDDDN